MTAIASTDMMSEADRTEGRDARDALTPCADRLAELAGAIAQDGVAGPSVLRLLGNMAREVSMLTNELVEDGVLSAPASPSPVALGEAS
jgi:hypothetical protein